MSTVVVINSLPSRAGAWRGILVIPVFEKEKQEGVLKSMFSLGYTLRSCLKTKQTPKTQFSKNTASVFTTDWDDFHVQPIWPFKHSLYVSSMLHDGRHHIELIARIPCPHDLSIRRIVN